MKTENIHRCYTQVTPKLKESLIKNSKRITIRKAKSFYR
jgi:hypothetical protein